LTRYTLAVRVLTCSSLLCSFAGALYPQTPLPTVDTALVRAPRPTWAAALASACDTLVGDTSRLRPVTVPQSNVPLLLPQRLLEQGDILSGSFYDAWPREPVKRYELFQFDPLTTRLILALATATIQCPPFDPAADGVSVFGFDSAQFHPTIRGTWHVLGVWAHDAHRLYGLSRDLWGARALVSAMRRRVVPPPDSATKQVPP